MGEAAVHPARGTMLKWKLTLLVRAAVDDALRIDVQVTNRVPVTGIERKEKCGQPCGALLFPLGNRPR